MRQIRGAGQRDGGRECVMSALPQPRSGARTLLVAPTGGRALATFAGAAVLVALGSALLARHHPTVAVVCAGTATCAMIGLSGRPLWRFARRHPLLLGGATAVAALAVVWLVVGLTRSASGGWPSLATPEGSSPGTGLALPGRIFGAAPSLPSWPWRVGRVPVLPLALMLLGAGGGLALVSDAVRVYLGLTPPARTAWRLISARRTRGGRVTSRALPGAVLIALATFLAVGLASSYTSAHPGFEAIAILAIVSWSALLIASPLIIGLSMQLDLDKSGRAREEERLRFAAHLHDSVLQTLALIQRQSHDPTVVGRLARRQEYSLRAWMAGESELDGSTIATAVRAVIAEVEDEAELVVALTAIGDAPIDERGETLVAAAREVLRNSARHARGAAVYAFLDVGIEGCELFIRDEGPGFDPEQTPPERRGLRDGVVGRMALAGGSATIDSRIGEGTEVTLRITLEGRT
ncbi:MAG: sensor histidine kinase [Solirubrobacteraceae bacterium]